MLIIGIDPGISGSICFFEEGKIIQVIEMPTMTEGTKKKKQVNGAQIYNEILKKTKTMVFLTCDLKCNDKIIANASGVWKIYKNK